MSEQSKDRNGETQNDKERPDQREEEAKPVLTLDQSRKKKEKWIMIAMIALAAVAVIVTALVLLYTRWVKKPKLPPEPGQSGHVAESKAPNDPNVSDDPNAPNVDPTPEPTLDFEAIQPKVSGERRSTDIYTFLIFGSDTTSGLTDTMMVGTYDITNQKATVMSLPRDTIVNNTGRRITDKKLNAVYTLWGAGDRGVTALKNEVSELVGFMPDYYVRIDWELVGEMVDAIGGVWFDNPYHMEYYDPYQDLIIYQEQGYRKLNGRDAMQVVRWRHNNPGVPYNPGVSKNTVASDLERLEVQHAFLKAVLKQTLQIQNVFRIGQLAELFGNRVESDLSVENIFWFAKEAVLGGLQVEDVNFCTMPVAGGSYYQAQYDTTYSFVYPIQRQLLTIINESLNPFVEQVTIRQLDLMYVASDGSLQSSTGWLADPSVGVVQVRPTQDPEESDPLESGEPTESGEPAESGEPIESAEPTESGQPVHSEPTESEPPTEPAPATEPPEPPQGPEEGDPAGNLD